MSKLKLGVVGGLGMMASPIAEHLLNSENAEVRVVHDRGKRDPRRDACRAAWKRHGAALIDDIGKLAQTPELDGVVLCCGKNGDDAPLIAQLSATLPAGCFICQLSTVSAAFARAAQAFLSARDLQYANYPLTGGPKGAQSATMLILAAGDKALYQRLLPTLEQLGQPRFFGDRVDAGAEVKLIGHLMVYSGLWGIASAAAVHSQRFAGGVIGGSEQTAFFDFLNQGAGGTRQWDVVLRQAIAADQYQGGFLLPHAVVDAIYAAELAIESGLPRAAFEPMINTALAFAFILRQQPDAAQCGTQLLLKQLSGGNAAALDQFIAEHRADHSDPAALLSACVEALPADLARSTAREISVSRLEALAACEEAVARTAAE